MSASRHCLPEATQRVEAIDLLFHCAGRSQHGKRKWDKSIFAGEEIKNVQLGSFSSKVALVEA